MILTGVITNTLNLILLFTINKGAYLTANEYIIMVSGLIEMAILIMVLYRKDKRGLHDMIAGTKVIDLKANYSHSKVIDAEIIEEIEQKDKDKLIKEMNILLSEWKMIQSLFIKMQKGYLIRVKQKLNMKL